MMEIIDGDICPFCERAYDWYCHQNCKETKKLIEKLSMLRKRKLITGLIVCELSDREIKFIIDALEGLYEGGNP